MASSSDITSVIRLSSIAGSGFLAGFITSFSWYGVPTVATAPTDMLVRQWRTMYKIGASTAPVIALICSGGYAFLAYGARSQRTNGPVSPSLLYGAAAAIIPAIAPYTILVMRPGANDELMEMAEKADKGEKGESIGSNERINKLLGAWTVMNYVRAGTVAVGTALGIYASQL